MLSAGELQGLEAMTSSGKINFNKHCQFKYRELIVIIFPFRIYRYVPFSIRFSVTEPG
jgi:hypothetical protein